MRMELIWIRIEHPLSVFKITIIIWMSLELKHKNFKDQYKIKVRVKKNWYQAPHVYICGFNWHYFQALLNCWLSPLNAHVLCRNICIIYQYWFACCIICHVFFFLCLHTTLRFLQLFSTQRCYDWHHYFIFSACEINLLFLYITLLSQWNWL